jgi:predicted dehydrogenase
MTPLGIGIIGAGKHGLRYIRHLTEDVPDATLVAVSRRDRREGEPVAAAHRCAFYEDWRALVEDPRVQAIVTAVPVALNVAIAEAACRAGKHLLIEKPLAPTVDDGRRIVAAVRAAGVHAMVAQTLRFDATVAAVRQALPAIGRVHAITLSQRFEPSTLPWIDRQDQSGGGVMLQTGIHSIDLLRVLLGREVVEVSCVTARVCTAETEDNFVMLARLDADGMLGQIAGSRAAGGRSGAIEIAGAEGQIAADHVHRVGWLIRGTTRTPIAVGASIPTVREALRAFVAAVHAGGPVPVTVEEGLRAVAVAEAAYRSAALGGAPVPVRYD